MRRTQAIILISMVALAACARVPNSAPDASAEVADGPDVLVIVEPNSLSAATPPPEPKRGLFAFLRKRDPEPATTPLSNEELLAEALIDEGAEPVLTTDASGVVPSMTDEEILARSIVAPENPQPSKRPRLFSLFSKRVPGEVAAAPTPTEIMLSEGPPPGKPSMTDEEIAARSKGPDDVAEPPKRKGFFAFLGGRNAGDSEFPPAEDDTGTSGPAPLGFGMLASACDVKKRDLGAEVSRSPGSGSYRLYDTAPGSVVPRVQYVTGFKDGCPRKFIAALALFGSPVVHETKRYDRSNSRSFSTADNAYEKVKSRVCGVKRGAFCPGNKIDKLGRDVALLTAYPAFGNTSQWLDMVFYKGTVAGHAVEN